MSMKTIYLRHQELRHHEEGARLARSARCRSTSFTTTRSSGIDRAKLEAWAKVVGWEVLLNRAGTTFRKLPDDAKQNIDERKAIKLMLEQPSMIKRPVLERGAHCSSALRKSAIRALDSLRPHSAVSLRQACKFT